MIRKVGSVSESNPTNEQTIFAKRLRLNLDLEDDKICIS